MKRRDRQRCSEPHPKVKDAICLRGEGHFGLHQADIFSIRINADGRDSIDTSCPTSMSWGVGKIVSTPIENYQPVVPGYDYHRQRFSLINRLSACKRLIELATTERSKNYWQEQVNEITHDLNALEISSGL